MIVWDGSSGTRMPEFGSTVMSPSARKRSTAERTGVDFEQMQKAASERIPVRRVGHPEDIANVVAFLVSEDASYVSGQTIYVAGGPVG